LFGAGNWSVHSSNAPFYLLKAIQSLDALRRRRSAANSSAGFSETGGVCRPLVDCRAGRKQQRETKRQAKRLKKGRLFHDFRPPSKSKFLKYQSSGGKKEKETRIFRRFSSFMQIPAEKN
jgi:hypothetical protein